MITVILNDGPYGTERPYNGLRLSLSLAKSNEDVRVFLTGDGVLCALSGQKTPSGFYNIQRMIKGLLQRNCPVHA